MVLPPHHDPAARRRLKARARLRRQFRALRNRVPQLGRLIERLQSDRAFLYRLPVALALILGGLFSFLPVLGIWMLPLGLMLLAVDLPILQGPVNLGMIRLRRRLRRWFPRRKG
jgi:hypothetical protein